MAISRSGCARAGPGSSLWDGVVPPGPDARRQGESAGPAGAESESAGGEDGGDASDDGTHSREGSVCGVISSSAIEFGGGHEKSSIKNPPNTHVTVALTATTTPLQKGSSIKRQSEPDSP